MASFTPAPNPVVGCRLSVVGEPSRIDNRQLTTDNSSQRERIHQPRQRDAAEEQRAEHQEKKANALFARVFPEQGEVNGRGQRVNEHQHQMIAEQAHSFRPSEMSKTSSTSKRFMRPAVIVKAVPCSYVIDVTSPCTPMPTPTKYSSPEPMEPMAARKRRSEPPVWPIV